MALFERVRRHGAYLGSLVIGLSITPVLAAFDHDEAEPTLQTRGAYLARAADCMACHSPAGKPAYAGGLAIQSPMGAIPAPNITPDKATGIGLYSLQEFTRALREGIRRDGARLYPAMPYTAYAGMSDEDVKVLYHYFMNEVTPVEHRVAGPDLLFPFNQRTLMRPWNLLFLSEQRFTPDPERPTQLERGRYLVDHLAHCGTCHTPRNIMMAERSNAYLGGAALGGWYAPNITASHQSGIGRWHNDELIRYLKTGRAPGKAQAAGPMGEAVVHSLSHLDDDDLKAIAAWLKQAPPREDPEDTLPRSARGYPRIEQDWQMGHPMAMDAPVRQEGATLYRNNCASCHGENGAGTQDGYVPSLFYNSTVGAVTRNNLVMVILNGVDRPIGAIPVSMPGFGEGSGAQALDDEEIATLANYVTSTFGDGQRTLSADQVRILRQGGAEPILVTLTRWSYWLAAPIVAVGIILSLRWYRRRQRRKLQR